MRKPYALGGRGGFIIVFFAAALVAASMAHADELARGDLAITGLGLEVEHDPVITAVDVPSYVQTFFGGKVGAEAPPAPGLSAIGELTGPGIDVPITLATTPGQKFAIPALHEKGDYTLQNIRLAGPGGEFLQPAVPNSATIRVTDVLKTTVKVRQLTAKELRERGIFIDERNYDVYEYTFIFGVDGSTVEIPYPVMIDRRTREIIPLERARFGMLPFPKLQKPPRFTPPTVAPFDLIPDGGGVREGAKEKEPIGKGVALPAALVVPTGFGVLHQFFAVILQVGNTAPEGSNIRLDGITARINSPQTMRVSKVVPAVALGQPVPITDPDTGATFLVAGAEGSAEWTLEALKSGTHTVDIDVQATYQKPGQEDFHLGGRVSASIVVNDPRFHVNFSHPDVVRKDDKYTAFAFITNLSAQRQHVFLDLSEIPACSSGSQANNVCRYEGDARVELDIEPGAMVTVPHKLISRVTGHVYAGAGSASDETVGVSVSLFMGVSETGIPLSPATLVMPYHARFLPTEFVDANLQLLGLGYSLATAPLTRVTALKPRVITTDVFRRAQQIALAGQRVFTIRHARETNDPAENRDPFFHLSLDLLGNVERADLENLMPELEEYDDLRRQEEAGRIGAAAMARQLEANNTTQSATQLVDDYAAATSHRTPFFFAYIHGPPVAGNERPYKMSVRGLASGSWMDVPAEAGSGWVRGLKYGELTRLDTGGESGELALVGRWTENLRVTIVPATSNFTLDLLYPDTATGTMLRARIPFQAIPGATITLDIIRGSHNLGIPATIAAVPQTPLRVLGAAQDMHLDPGGHVVGLLFNRPVTVPANTKLRDLFELTIDVDAASYTAKRGVAAAVLQEDARIAMITCDKTLSKNADYLLAIKDLGGFSANDIVPRVDNDRLAAILTGKVLAADGTAVPNTLVKMTMSNTRHRDFDGMATDLVQYDTAGDDGRFVFEYVPRDVSRNLFGEYELLAETDDGKQAFLQGSVRQPGEVHTANLVFLGRGSARGQLRWEDGEPIPNWKVSGGSPLFGGMADVRTDANGYFEVLNLPVGPVVLSTVDPDGRMVYATAAIRTAGEIVTQDLVAIRKEGPPPGVATVRVLVLRSDTMQPVSGAQVGVGSPQVPLWTAETGSDGRYEFRGVPAGLMSIIAADFSVSRHNAAVEVELRGDQILEQTLVLQAGDTSVKYAILEGVVTRDDPASPGDVTKDQPVAGAILNVYGMPAVTAGADGTYTFPELPTSYTGRWMQVYDPATTRKGWFRIPTLVEGKNRFPIRLESLDPFGRATYRVRLWGAKGEPVAAERVFIPGFPPTNFQNKGGGVYELPDIRVPQSDTVWAVTAPDGPYGEQFVKTTARVDFGGQTAIADLRLPGIGTVVAKIEVEQPCSTPPCYAQAIGPVAMTYTVWNDYLQKTEGKTVIGQPDPATGLVHFDKVPVRQNVRFATDRHPAGFDDEIVVLAYDGDARNISLKLKTIGNVTGRVLGHDGVTPIPGATVRIKTGTAIYAPGLTKQDGTFLFAAIPAGVEFDVVAEIEQDGIFRTGSVSGKTPEGGGPVSDLVIVMREQAEVEGRVVKNSDGATVPLAYYWLRELTWPYRAIGSPLEPLQADIHGRFVVTNVFTGPFRITAVAPDNQELRGDYQGELTEEGDVSQHDVAVRIGGDGAGTVAITVVDPLLGFEPVANAEVTLRRNGKLFDFTSTNDAGVAYFDEVPAGTTYTAIVYSKQRGRAGQSNAFSVVNAQTTSLSIPLDFLGVVSGTLTDPDTTPADLPVRGQPVSYTGNHVGLRATTDTNGNFEIQGVPEGEFKLSAWELSTQRIAVGPAGLFISKLVPEQRNVHLQLERMGTLTVKVYLPNDSGGPGELAPLAEVTAKQCTVCNQNSPDYPYFRSIQGNPVVFPRMFRRVGYSLEVRELGGEARTVKTGGIFPANGALTHEQIVVLPSSGTLEITVLDGQGHPVADAEVQVSGARSAKVFSGADGKITLPASPFGWYSVTARKDNVTAAASGELKSRSTPLRLTLNLGTNITVGGFVEAEEGTRVPSPATRVILTVNTNLLITSLRMETFTGADGKYTFTGIPVGNTTLALQFVGPDDTTIGAKLSQSIPNGTTGTVTLPDVKLDATPPRVLNVDPPANSTNVSPSTQISVTFSEPLAARFLDKQYFDLIATDDGARVQSTVLGTVRADGTYVVKIIPPPAPAPQKFPLKSNVLYRFAIRDGIEDTTGNKLKTAIGTSFTTVDYTEPAIVKITPPVTEPLPQQVTFKVKFNKAVDVHSFDAGHGGVLKLEKIEGETKTLVPISPPALDVVDPSTIVFAPQGVAIEEAKRYRVTISGVRDTLDPANTQVGTAVYDYAAFDLVKPVVTIVSPVGAGEKLVSGILYSAGVTIADEGTGATSQDIAYVDWLDKDGVSVKRVKTAPFAYAFVAPSAQTFTLQATATDLSNNTSATPASFTWDVVPNAAPTNITVTHNVSSVYPNKPVETRVRFQDEGVAVTVTLELRGTNLDGTPLVQLLGSKNVTRASGSVEFPEVVFTWTAPLALKDGTATIVATATDSVNHSASGDAPIAIDLDQAKPQITSFTPAAETRYKFGVNGTYTIEVQAKDLETGIARAVLTVGGVEVLNATGSGPKFTKVITVPPKNADTRVPIVVTIYDHRDNAISETHEVIYERVDDESLPKAAWITPLDGAALPSNASGWQTTLRVQATDDVKVTSVRFTSSALATPIELTAPKSGTTDIYETKATLAFPSGGAPFTITATVADGDPAHDVELPITVEPVIANPIVTSDINITSAIAGQYANKSVLVRGNVKLYVSVPLTVKDLILVDGAMLSVPEETRLEVTVTDRLFVDADSRIDVSERGWLGGLRTREDNSFTNTSRSGRTTGATLGATNADASHAGIGGGYGAANATYGSVTDPSDFGSGGAAQPSGGNDAGGNGGGALVITGGRFVLAGPVRANGGTTSNTIWAAGAGGSIDLRARTLIASPLTRITANGGDATSSNEVDRGGGGGRIAVRVTERFDATTSVLQARGGRNTGSESSAYVDGGAGTVYLVRPNATLGELLVSSYDERNPSTAHRANATPLAATDFDAITIGPRTLARFDVAVPANVTSDATATIVGPADVPSLTMGATTPVAGSDVSQTASISTSYTATSTVGIREVRTILSAQPADVIAYPKFATTIPSTPSAITIPHNAPPATAALKLRAIDRAGRVVETSAVSFHVIANTAPVVDQFDVTPNGTVYANTTLAVAAAAHDDLAVKSLALATTTGTVTAQTAQTPTPQSMARAFTVAIPPATPAGTNVVLTLTAADDFPDRAATSARQTVTIRHDALPPSLAIATPAPNQQYTEGSGATFTVAVDASDAEVAVQRVVATFDGTEYDLTFSSGTRWTRNIPLPSVDGTEPVAKSVTVRAYDYENNVATKEAAFTVAPLIDPNAPALSWVCGSPSAMYPAGYAAEFQVSAIPNIPTNGISTMELTLGSAAAVDFARIGTTDVWKATAPIPAGTADGTQLDVRVVAVSVAGNESALLGTVTAVSGITINTASAISATDFSFENQSLIVTTNGVLTITGPHTLRNLVVLNGGKVVQQHVDKQSADELKVARMYVACGGSIDVSALGMTLRTSVLGAGVPDSSSAGSHIGRGSVWWRAAGGVFGSVYEPKEPGGGGNTSNLTTGGAGGGSVRIRATGAIIVDGSVLANGATAGAGGSGAGGSVWLATASLLGGAGKIEARAPNGSSSAGGGGAIALDYATTSGTYTTDARGSTTSADPSRTSAPGTILRRAAGSNGELTIDAKATALSWTSYTELPAFGVATVASVNGATVTIAEDRFVPPALTGHRLRAYAPDGTVRGTYRLAAVAKHATTATADNWALINTLDSTDYSGWLMYAPDSLGGKKWLAVRLSGTQWQYDSDTAFVNFTPSANQLLFATFTKSGNRFTALESIHCDAVCGTISGIASAEVLAGQFDTDVRFNNANDALRTDDAGELILRPDVERRAFTIAAASPALTLETLSGDAVQPGDVLRGVYQFDKIKLVNARVLTEDLVDAPVEKDTASSLVSGNSGAPRVDVSKIAFSANLDGQHTLVGEEGAIVDDDAPVDVAVRTGTTARPTPPLFFMDDFFGTRTVGGFSVRHVDNGQNTGGTGNTVERITGEGYVAFSVAQTNAPMQLGLAPNNAASDYSEPNHNTFRLLVNGTYQIWANAANTNKSGSFTTATRFRIEKATSAIRWYVDDTLVHEMTANVPASVLFDISMRQTTFGEVTSIEYVTTGLTQRTRSAKVNAGGSFTVTLANATPGQPAAFRARDRHAFSMETAARNPGNVPDDIGITAVDLTPSALLGSRPGTGTATLRTPAGKEGALVTLTSNHVAASVPSTITIPPGATSGSFPITTNPVLTDTDVTISAAYGGIGTSAVLHLLRDTVAPSVAITAPAANSEYTEGQPQKIDVRATIADADTGIKRAWVELDGEQFAMALSNGTWTALVPVPFVANDATLDLVVKAEDFSANAGSSAPHPIVVHPIADATVPTAAWKCGSGEQLLPVGYPATLAVIATPPNATNVIAKVEFTLSGPAGATTLRATDLGNNVWSAPFVVPNVADGSLYTIHAVATAAGGAMASVGGALRVVNGPLEEIRTNTTIASTTTTYDNKSVVVYEGATLTIDGTHAFRRLVILGTLTHAALKKVDVTATDVFVACGGAIDVTGMGYDNSTRYPGIAALTSGMGGNHVGRGGNVTNSGFTFGSIERPNELGGGAHSGARGGGMVKIDADSVIVDGDIRANGANISNANGWAGGAGGSVWILADTIAGTGTITTNGGDGCGGGGGGAISLDASVSLGSTLQLTSRGGSAGCAGREGGPGTARTSKPAAPLGDVVIDSAGTNAATMELPSFGTGTAQTGTTGATLVRATTAAPFFSNHWVRITAPDGTVRGTWRIAPFPTATATLTLVPNAGETISLAAGDTYQGVYRFDSLTVRGATTLQSSDPIETTTQTISGTLATTRIRSDALHLTSGALLEHRDSLPPDALTIEVANELRIDAGAAIDVTGLGYNSSTRYTGIAALTSTQGGCHIGRGNAVTASGFTFGSVYRPFEAGGGAHSGARGGGAVKIDAGSLVLAGEIRANGANISAANGWSGGAGGSVWIAADSISGGGAISANGGDGCGGGGGGAIAIHHLQAAHGLTVAARGGAAGCGAVGGAGSIYEFKSSSTLGTLLLDNTGRGPATAELPSLGSGTAAAGTTGAQLVLTRATDVPQFFSGHWIVTAKGTWRIGKIDGKTVTLVPNAGEPIALAEGDAWEGIYRFDAVTTFETTLVSADRIVVGGTP